MSEARILARPLIQKSTLALPGIVALGFAVRTFHLSHQSLWMDEFFTRYYPEVFGQHFLWTWGLRLEPTPPLYYELMAAWMRLFGTSEAALRSPSVLASGLTIPLVFLLGRELGDRRVGLVAALLFALAPLQINYAQEARSYAVLLVPVTLALLGIARFLRGADGGAVSLGAKPRPGLVLYGTGTAMAIWCHPTLAFFAAASGVVVTGALLGEDGIRPGRPVLIWAGVNALVLVAVLPVAIAMVDVARSPAPIAWMGPLTPGAVAYTLSALATGIETPMKLPGAELTLLLMSLLCLALPASRLGRRGWMVLVAVPGLSFVFMTIASLAHLILLPRTVLWLGIPLCVALACALVRPTRLRPPLLAAVVLAWGVGLGYQLGVNNQKEPWRGVIHTIGPDLAAADNVVLAPYAPPAAIQYYAPEVTRLEMWRGPQPAGIDLTLLPARMGVPRVDREAVVRQIQAGHHVWLFARGPDLPLLPALLKQVPPPRQRLEGRCGAGICLLALSW